MYFVLYQKNPLYKIVDRPEGPEKNYKKVFNKKLLKMEYI